MKHGLCFAILLCTASSALADNPESYGERLYRGEAKLSGVIAGHSMEMPQAVLACTNCHAARPDGAAAQTTAPDLRGGWLGQFRSRRNGPVGRYTQAGFCRALRTGIDPMYVVLPVQMPRFTMPDLDCAALWAYLNGAP
jgi:hypothetical protein